ncbi:MAG: M23 family metallopeptidase [Clostridia bacterium]|nr:M23 family metallopeptidase [Deltaproteobacteria bacterium]
MRRMLNEHYAIIVLDQTGRTIAKHRLSRARVERWTASLASAIFIGIACGIHALTLRPETRATHDIRNENKELEVLVNRLELQLPELRRVNLAANIAFEQIWAKSGLGVEARGLAVGPFESVSNIDRTHASPLAAVEPLALPLEYERILGEGRMAQQKLGELLEYFHDAERMLSNTPSLRPAHSPFITSTFGRRNDPVHGGLAIHKGLDIAGSIGSEVFAPADGVVIFVGKRGGYGNVIVVDHGYGLQTHYAHLSRFRCIVGDHIRRGDMIAEMGSTGKSTGPHLHYEVRCYGRPLDPARFILD